MPVILPPDAYEIWLDTLNVDAETAAALIAPAQDELFETYEIAPLVNRVANDGPEVQAPYTALPPQTAKVPAKKARPKPDDDRQSSLF